MLPNAEHTATEATLITARLTRKVQIPDAVSHPSHRRIWKPQTSLQTVLAALLLNDLTNNIRSNPHFLGNYRTDRPPKSPQNESCPAS